MYEPIAARSEVVLIACAIHPAEMKVGQAHNHTENTTEKQTGMP